MTKAKIMLLSIIYFLSGCASVPSVKAPTLGKTTFLEMTNQDSVYAMFSLADTGEVLFEKLLAKKPETLMPMYARNKTTYDSDSKEPKQYRDCIILKRSRIHQACPDKPTKGSVLIKNELTGVGLVTGAIMSPFIIFEATLQTLTGDTKGARKKMGEFDEATEPKFDQKNINNVGNTILKYLTDGYTLALENGTESGYLIEITRTHGEAARKANKLTLLNAQKFLIHQNLYQGKSDGLYGEKTKNALSQFQKKQRLKATGKLDDTTRIALVDQFQATEFNYILASRQNTIESYGRFIAENPGSKNIALATSKKNELVAIQNRERAKINKQKRIALAEKKRKQQAVQRRKTLAEISNATWERGDLAYLCRKKFWNLFSNWETCDARVLEITRSKAHVEFEWGCGIGWQQGDTEWVDLSALKPRDNCDSYMHLLE